MSFGKMNGLALIKRHYKEKDSDGFKNDTDFVLAVFTAIVKVGMVLKGGLI